ncbi:MAG: hypothetical protein CMF72_19880 [Mameliella sp.]|nr:hypothetical protein [Mameliella sp.]
MAYAEPRGDNFPAEMLRISVPPNRSGLVNVDRLSVKRLVGAQSHRDINLAAGFGSIEKPQPIAAELF